MKRRIKQDGTKSFCCSSAVRMLQLCHKSARTRLQVRRLTARWTQSVFEEVLHLENKSEVFHEPTGNRFEAEASAACLEVDVNFY
ncbi:hypothetical protein FQA47_010987 [Oryzias melastigma]|uniref:Uncharacterized protein n=1 Tax=Oryzias melastigma TaxID=30732 RepID=A0A834BVW4_ORYME|nr:hypothetical protein FQA47_010987 [Oryzias melastigma]